MKQEKNWEGCSHEGCAMKGPHEHKEQKGAAPGMRHAKEEPKTGTYQKETQRGGIKEPGAGPAREAKGERGEHWGEPKNPAHEPKKGGQEKREKGKQEPRR